MLAHISSADARDGGAEVNVRPQVEVRSVLLQILSVAHGREEVVVFRAGTEVGEGGEELGGDELGILVDVVEENTADLVVGLEEPKLKGLG
jgi:hypothetical protein